MLLTIVLALVFIASICLMLYSAVALVQNKKFFGSAPKDVQAAIQDKPERFKGAKTIGGVLLSISLFGCAFAFIYGAINGIQNGFTFWQFFARFLIMLYLYKAFDMVCFDWLLLTKSHFFQHYFPEIEGCESLEKYGFNLKSQIAKLIVFPFVSLLAAWICTLFS